MTGGVLAVFAHPDDESLLAGGVLAGCAASGLRVSIVSMTRGERGPTAIPEIADRTGLAEVREVELRAAADALGASSAECLDYPDGELASADEENVVSALADLVERERPAAVISFSAEGLYWHPDHLAVVRYLAAALDRLGDRRPVWTYGATWPQGHVSRLVSLMHARSLPTDLWGIEPDAFGAPAEAITTSIDVRSFLPAKLGALRGYRSQLGPGHLLNALPGDLAEEFLGREYFVRQTPEQPGEDWLTGTLQRQ
jgi:LmbE family N-acetylglucosaminyl deacetylase